MTTTTDVSDFTRLPDDAELTETVPMLEEHIGAAVAACVQWKQWWFR
jgi:hypothetical protein